MKVQSKWFLSAVVGFVAAIVLTAVTSFGTIKSNTTAKNTMFLTSITNIETVK